MKHYSYIASLTLLWLAAGCNESTIAIKTVSHRRFDNAAWQEVYQAAHATMSEYFRIDEADYRSGVIRSIPIIVRAPVEDRLLGKPLSSPRQIRKIAEIRIEPQGSAVVVWCGVMVQRSETVSHLVYAAQRSIDDMPNKTPLQESEGRAEQGNLTWSTSGYDHKLERELLAAIAERRSKVQGLD